MKAFTAATGYAPISAPYTVKASEPTRLITRSRTMRLIISDTATSTEATYPSSSSQSFPSIPPFSSVRCEAMRCVGIRPSGPNGKARRAHWLAGKGIANRRRAGGGCGPERATRETGPMRLNTGGSSNVEDRRGMGGLAAGGGVGAVILGLLYMLLGGNPGDIQQSPAPGSNAGAPAQQNDAQSQFVRQVLRSTELTWADQFQKMGRQYQDPRLVLYSGAYPSACGMGQAAMGPFYCPRDEKVYLDMSFFDELDQRFHAPGQFADAYVIAHEVGHHVQNLLGISEQVQQAEQSS